MQKTIFLIVLSLSVMAFDADRVDITKLNAMIKVDYTGLMYSGYLPLNPEATIQFHYVFYPAYDEPTSKPLVLWLNGGPGCSSLQGAVNENGPFVFIEETDTFVLNDYSWTHFANMLYIESPIEVGFSYGPKQKQSDESTANYNLEAIVQFLIKFPEYINRQFFISGESYAGIYIPTLASKIIDYNLNPTNILVRKINLEGLAIGNGCTHTSECTEVGQTFPIHQLKFYGRHGFYSPELYEQVLAVQDDCYGQGSQVCQDIVKQVDTECNFEGAILFNPYNIYGKCFTYTPAGMKQSKPKIRSSFQLNEDEIPPCADVTGTLGWFRNKEFMELIHVRTDIVWQICAPWKTEDYEMDPRASYYLYSKLMKNSIRILHFSGDVDAVVPITGTLFWINQLQNELFLATIKPWRPWFVDPRPERAEFDDVQNAGNVWDLDGLTFVSIRNAGHMVVMEKRAEGVLFMKSFINHQYLA